MLLPEHCLVTMVGIGVNKNITLTTVSYTLD